MNRYLTFLSNSLRRVLFVLLALALLAAPGLAYAQQEPNGISVPSLNWYTLYGNGDLDRAEAMTSDSSGNLYVVGSTDHGWANTGMQPLHRFTPQEAGHPDSVIANNLVIAKFNSAGTLIWYTYYGSSRAFTHGESILIDGSGNLYIIGQSHAEWDGLTPKRAFHGPSLTPDGKPNDDVFILKLNNAGAYQWHTFYGSDKVEIGFKAVLESGGNILIAGSTIAPWAGLTPKRPFSGETNFFALSVDAKGDYRWHTFYGMQTGSMGIEDLLVDTAGDVYLTGYADAGFTGFQPLHPKDPTNQGLPDILVMKMSNAGVLQWYTFFGGSWEDFGNAIALYGGNLYLTGRSVKSWPGFDPLHPFDDNMYGNLFVLKLNSAGAYQWHTFYGPAAGKALAIDSQGRLFVAGNGSGFWNMNPASPYQGGWDNLLMVFDAQGKYQSHGYYGYDVEEFTYEGVSEIRIVGDKLYMFGNSGYNWPAFSFPPLHISFDESDVFLASISLVDKPSCITTTNLWLPGNPWEMGRTIPLSASMVCADGVPTAGKVTFKDGATILGVADVYGGYASLNFTPNALGTHLITAQFSGAPGFLPSQTSQAFPLEVVKAETSVSLSGQYSSSPYGTDAVFSVSVTPVEQNIYQPSGWVVLKDGTRVVGGSLLTDGSAEIRISGLPVGYTSLTAEYLGGYSFYTSTSAALNYQVTKADTSTTFAALPGDTLSYGSDLTLKATVTHAGSASVKPDGTVTFHVDAQEIGSATLVNGTAAVTIHTLPLGTHQVTSIYPGSSNFNPSVTVISQIEITGGVPRITLAPEGGSAINSGETKRFIVTVQGAYPDLIQPTGTVTLYEGETEIATLTLVDGVATSDPLTLSDGAHSFTATYTGDAMYLNETSKPAVVIVAGTPVYLPVMVR